MTTKKDSFPGRLLREPLLHFLLIGAAIFAVTGLGGDGDNPAEEPGRIVLTKADQDRIQQRFQATWRRSATPDEMAILVEEAIREEVYVREARSLGLDRGDAIVRQRLHQKMAFLIASAAPAETPSDDVLRAYFDANAEIYKSRGRVSFEQIFLGEAPDENTVQSALASLRGGGDPNRTGQHTLMPPAMRLSGKDAIDGTFGTSMFAGLADTPLNEWSGPVRSGFGVHLVRVTERQEPEIPEFAAVREQVLRDWLKAETERFEADTYRRLLEQYEVEIEGADTR